MQADLLLHQELPEGALEGAQDRVRSARGVSFKAAPRAHCMLINFDDFTIVK